MKQTLLIGLLSLLVASGAAWAAEQAGVVERPDGAPGNHFYLGNRAPLVPSPFVKLPVGAVRPEGWIRRQLELEADGFSGRLSELSGFLREDGNAWLSPTGEGHSYWEEVPYWLKGFIDLGYLLDDQRIIAEAHTWIEASLAGQADDGWFGPRANRGGRHRSTAEGKPDLWPNMIMLNVLQSYHEHSGDPRVIDLMTRYFRWQLDLPDDDFLPPFWQQQRAGDNLAGVYWLYNRTGERWLLDLATKIHRNMAPWHREIASWHGVNICQCFRAPTIYWMQSRQPEHRAAAERNYQTVMTLYGQVPGGMFGADENCRPGYTGPRQAAESCSMAELMLSCEMLLTITGESKWADRCETVAFDSFPACMTADLKALHYLTAPNMVLCDRHSKSPGLQNRGPMLLFDPRGHRCCQHNIGHGWPRFAQHLWLAAPGGGLAAAMYGPCRVRAKVGDGTEIVIAENTQYPFGDAIELSVQTPKPVAFPLYLRVPGWCDAPALAINGAGVAAQASPGSYLVVDRTWSDGDTVRLTLPMKITVTRWTENHHSASVHRGPLTYSLKIGEKYVRVGGTDDWPALEIHPTTPWNYALVLDPDDPARSFEVVEGRWPSDEQPFVADGAPIELRAKARKIPAWTLDDLGLVGPMNDSPVLSDEPVETVSLIPMGCARLRISAFPVIGEGPDARAWQDPCTSTPWSASHCWEGDTVLAIDDGVLPRSSGDATIPRFTWWNHRGTTEWVALGLDEPAPVGQIEVYWFDDTGRGHCRVPKSWRAEWRDGDAWKPVATRDEYGVALDRFNRVTFDPVTTREIRLVVELQPEFSAGILECRVK